MSAADLPDVSAAGPNGSGVSPASSPQPPRIRGDAGEVTIIGAGIIGICVAANLAEAGYAVTVFDRTGICEETSSGNAAALAFPDVLPMAHKGMIRQLPKWLSDPLGPLAIPPSYLPTLLPWLYRFWRAGSASNYEASLVAQASLMKLAEAEWSALMQRSGTQPMLREQGSLELYESQGEFEASLPGWGVRDRFGIPYRHVDGDELASLQPGLSSRFVKATFVPGWKTVADPKLLGKAVWRHAETLGARFRKGVVQGVGGDDSGATVYLADGSKHRTGKLVIAAGAWSHLLAKELRDHIPLETERGYNTTLPVGAFDVRRQLIFPGHGFVITPMQTGLRVGGAVELAGLKRPPNYSRARAMMKKAQSFLPGLSPQGGREWMGYRPSLPDSLPVIGRASVRNIFYAFGHGHLGLTQSAATGRLVRDLVAGQASPIDLTPFTAQRF